MKQKRSDHSEYFDFLDTPVGTLYLVFHASSLISISHQKPKGMVLKKTSASRQVIRELAEFFERKRTAFTCKTSFQEGTDFEQQVWNALTAVPYGETRTYKWLAEKIGKPQAARAVGQALSRNPIPIVFPCHRIIESDGRLGGYASGTDVKRRLLEIEYYTQLSRT